MDQNVGLPEEWSPAEEVFEHYSALPVLIASEEIKDSKSVFVKVSKESLQPEFIWILILTESC